MRHSTNRFASGAALLLVSLVACASGPTIRTDSNPASEIAGFATYGWVPVLGTDKAGYESIVTARLKKSVSRELELRGYRYVERTPDMLVNFYVNLEDKQQVTSTPTSRATFGRGYYGYRAGYYHTWPEYEVQVREYTEGTLTIDIVDAEKQILAWTGTLQDRVSRKVMDASDGVALRTATSQLFERYPYRAAPHL